VSLSRAEGVAVTDLETELREAMIATVADARPPRDLMERVRQRRRRGRARRLTATAACGAVIVAAVPLSLALLRPGGHQHPAVGATTSAPASSSQTPPTPRDGRPPPRGWVRHRDDAGDYIDTPAAWHVSTVSTLLEPVVRWVIGTGPVPGSGCAPRAALRRLSADGMLFQVIEYSGVTEPYSFPQRHGRLALGPIGGPFECWGVKTHLVVFQDGGRYFQVQTVFGARAPASLRAQVTRSLNTLHIAPLAANMQPAALCRAGEWTYCPQAVWVSRVLNKAHVLDLSNQGTRAIVGQAGRRSFAVLTTRRRGGLSAIRCRSVSGMKVCRTRRGMVLRVHGLWLWFEPARSAYSTPPPGPGLPTRQALRRLVVAARVLPIS
jgi:hypothetical protein